MAVSYDFLLDRPPSCCLQRNPTFNFFISSLIHSSIHPSIYPSVHLFSYTSIRPSTHASIDPSINHPFIHSSISRRLFSPPLSFAILALPLHQYSNFADLEILTSKLILSSVVLLAILETPISGRRWRGGVSQGSGAFTSRRGKETASTSNPTRSFSHKAAWSWGFGSS